MDVVQVVINKDSNSSRRNRRTPRSTKTKINSQSVKSVGSLVTLWISVGIGLHRLVVIHLGVVSSSPEVETEVRAGRAVAHKEDVEEDGSPQ